MKKSLLSLPLLFLYASPLRGESVDLGPAALKVRKSLFEDTRSGNIHKALLSEKTQAYDGFSEYVKSKYKAWRLDFLGIPLFASAKGNYLERLPFSYKDECRAEQRVWNSSSDKRPDLELLHKQIESTANPFDMGSSLSYLGHLSESNSEYETIQGHKHTIRRKKPKSNKDPRCADAKRKSAFVIAPEQKTIPLEAYFSRDEIDHSQYLYLANISHRDRNGEDLYVARIRRNSVKHLLVHKVNFATGLKKLEELDLLGAAHFQTRFQFSSDVLLREQRINPRSSKLRSLKTRDLVFSVEANGEPGFSYSLLGGFSGVLSEEIFGKFMNTFRIKTLETTVYDSVLSRKGEDRITYPTLQFPLELSANKHEDLRLKNQVFLNSLELASAFGEHTSYNTIERSCSVWGYETIDRPNVRNHKHFGSIKEHLPHRVEKALTERSLLPRLPQSKVTGRFDTATKDFYNLHFEICQTRPNDFDGLDCATLQKP